MTTRKKRKIAAQRPGPTKEDFIPIWAWWRDDRGVRWAVCSEDCPVCGKNLRGSPMFPPPNFKEFDPDNMIYCLECGSRFRVYKYGEESA